MSDKQHNDYVDELTGIFLAESREQLQEMEAALLELENNISDEDAIRTVFRAAHTIKGSAGMIGLDRIMDFTHLTENLLDDIRSKKISIDSDIITLLLECRDFIGSLVDSFEANKNESVSNEQESRYNDLKERLSPYILPVEVITGFQKGKQTDKQKTAMSNSVVINASWHISLRFKPDVFRHGLDPYTFINYLESAGKIIRIKTVYDALPDFKDMDPESLYLGFEINFAGDTSKENLEQIFEFLHDESYIRILPPRSSIGEYVNLVHELPESPMLIGDILRSVGSLTENELQTALEIQKQLREDNDKGIKKTIGQIIIDEGMVHESVVKAAIEKQEKIRKTDKSSVKTIRIDAVKLDILVDMVGELVLSMARLTNHIKKNNIQELLDSASMVSNLINDVRESSMNLRLMQIGESFRRFERMVRDLCLSEGKEADLIISCGETELDKTMIEKINDPVMHLVRNAADHGIDPPERRKMLGKNPRGKIIINAYHETGSVIIEVRDDGSGLNKEKILQKAVEMGLVNSETAQHLSDDQIYSFIFVPGFSTADNITDVSGRGVGMDVVKKNIELLRGSVTVQSRENEGTVFRLRLPLTLAIIDGFLVEAGGLMLVFPLDMVDECIKLTKGHTGIKGNMDIINVRGEMVPFMRLKDFFKETDNIPATEYIIISEYGRRKAAFAVDAAVGEIQTVVKPIGKVFNKLRWISGATILGDGRVAFILDIPRLVQHIIAQEYYKAG